MPKFAIDEGLDPEIFDREPVDIREFFAEKIAQDIETLNEKIKERERLQSLAANQKLITLWKFCSFAPLLYPVKAIVDPSEIGSAFPHYIYSDPLYGEFRNNIPMSDADFQRYQQKGNTIPESYDLFFRRKTAIEAKIQHHEKEIVTYMTEKWAMKWMHFVDRHKRIVEYLKREQKEDYSD